ncbi:DUF4062 domain-containing protein [Undibacterium sp. SXout20W]|uniref:DUF4062 domain-containing protein n=1 Tax=Undibacterium sp. SXout20W TaxID=3413051 RepID=UPI003BF3BD99
MSVQHIGIFISSRFAEFNDLRKAIARKLNDFAYVPLHPIELNDNGADTESPSSLCINWVKRSELLILIVGDTYGPIVQGTDLSCTHIEYRTAMEEGSETRVLPFFISSSPKGSASSFDEKKLAEFKSEVLSNQRAAVYDRPKTEDDLQLIIDSIVHTIIRTVWEIRFQDNEQTAETDWEIGDDVTGISDTELTKLTSIRPEPISEIALLLKPPSAESAQDIARNQRAFAADEQLREAQLALQISERGIAEKHLREAYELRPLDPVTNEWLARVLLSKGKKSVAQEASKYAERAARIYEKTDQPLRAATSLILAARARSDVDKEQAQSYAESAVEQAGWYAQAHLELARQRIHAGKIVDSKASLKRAFYCHPIVLDNILGDLAFEKHRADLENLINGIQTEIDIPAQNILFAQSKISDILGRSNSRDQSFMSSPVLSQRIFSCRRMIRRQLRDIRAKAVDYIQANRMRREIHCESDEYALDVGAMTLNIKHIIEITKAPEIGKTFATGDVVLCYRLSGSTVIHTWLAPTSLEIRSMSKVKDVTFTGQDKILTWSPKLTSTSVKEYRTKEQNYNEDLARKVREKSILGEKEKNEINSQRRGFALGAIGAICAFPWMEFSFFQLAAAVTAAYGLSNGFRAFSRLPQLRKQIAQSEADISRLNLAIKTIEDNISEIQNQAVSVKKQLLDAIDIFEKKAISLLSVVMPFTGIRSARIGDWVVVDTKTIDTYAKKLGMTVVIIDDELLQIKNNLGLFRVEQKNGSEIKLSRKKAYFP